MRNLILILVIISALSVGCTENSRAKSFGGTMTVDLKPGQKLVTATWKEQALWYLTRPMREGEVPETHEFIESSALGIYEGKVILHESK